MPKKEIDSISISSLFWTQVKRNRVSFSFTGLPDSIHFTISWNEVTGKMSLHITKNTGDGKDKPRIEIALFDKNFLNELSSFAPSAMFFSNFKPARFNNYSRKARKQIRILFVDDLDSDTTNIPIKEKIANMWNQVSYINGSKLKIRDEFEKDFSSLVNDYSMKTFVSNNLKRLTSHTFKDKSLKGGVIFINKKPHLFFVINGRCYITLKKLTIYKFLCSFTKPEFAKSLLDYITGALDKLPSLQSYADSLPYNRPYQLYIEHES